MSKTRPRTYHFIGNLIRFLAFPDETGNRCAILELKVAPGAGAPPNHHAGEDESFYVLEGEFAFMLDGQKIDAKPGDFVKVPEGAVHAFSCVSEQPGRMLQVNAPGTAHEILFTEGGEAMPDETTDIPAPDGPPDIARIMQISSKAGITVVTPEGAPA